MADKPKSKRAKVGATRSSDVADADGFEERSVEQAIWFGIAKLEERIAKLEEALERVATPVTIQCFTNIDKFKGVMWPKTAAYPPQKGECIEGRSWDGREVVARLRVVQITHCISNEGAPYLRVELHL